jgi:hypothetical protein
MKLVGFSLWEASDGEIYVTFPSRGFGVSNGRRYFDYLRAVEGMPARTSAVKLWLVAEWRRQTMDDAPTAEGVAEGGAK